MKKNLQQEKDTLFKQHGILLLRKLLKDKISSALEISNEIVTRNSLNVLVDAEIDVELTSILDRLNNGE